MEANYIFQLKRDYKVCVFYKKLKETLTIVSNLDAVHLVVLIIEGSCTLQSSSQD